MKKEGTGRPEEPDIVLLAGARMRELRFEEVPDTEVRFRGTTGRNSVWESRRENLPGEAREGVVYRNGEVRVRIASEVVVEDEPRSARVRDRGRVGSESGQRKQSTEARTLENEREME